MQMAIMQCPVCGYIATHQIDFHHCPVCKSLVDMFHPFTTLCARGIWDEKSIVMIMEMAETGSHALESKGATRSFPNFDDLVFLLAQVACIPLLESDPVQCRVVLGKKAEKPVIARTPVLNAAMSFGALSKEAKMALSKGAAMAGGVANSGEGGMLDLGVNHDQNHPYRQICIVQNSSQPQWTCLLSLPILSGCCL